MDISESLHKTIDLYCENNKKDYSYKNVDTAIWENGLDAPNVSHNWIVEMFDAVNNEQPIGPVFFNGLNTDSASFLEELCEILEWSYEDTGERFNISIGENRVGLFIDLDAFSEELGSCYSYKVIPGQSA